MTVSYLIIGNGRVATHIEHYFTLLRIPSVSWSREQNSPEQLRELSSASDIVLVLISDSQIVEFIQQNDFLTSKPRVHFSGSLTTDLAFGAHPLTTFSNKKYSLETYQQIPFVCEKSSMSFEEFFPQLKNPHYAIEKEQKPKYHALCSMAGNFSTLLWQKLLSDFEIQLKLPPKVAHLYLEQVTLNLKQDYHNALTGPLVRGDVETLKNHLSALENDRFKEIYLSFVKMYSPEIYKELV